MSFHQLLLSAYAEVLFQKHKNLKHFILKNESMCGAKSESVTGSR